MISAALPARISDRLVEIDGPHWLWTGQINNKGYGQVHAAYLGDPDRPAQKRPVHAVVFEIVEHVVADGFELDHTCEHQVCAYPGCLDEVTHAENQRRSSWRQLYCRRAGHLYTPDNTYISPRGKRCRQCARDADARRTPRRRSPGRRGGP